MLLFGVLPLLAVIQQHPEVSVFEATANATIARTMDRLEAAGYMTRFDPQPPYPWNRFAITEKGAAFLRSG